MGLDKERCWRSLIGKEIPQGCPRVEILNIKNHCFLTSNAEAEKKQKKRMDRREESEEERNEEGSKKEAKITTLTDPSQSL